MDNLIKRIPLSVRIIAVCTINGQFVRLPAEMTGDSSASNGAELTIFVQADASADAAECSEYLSDYHRVQFVHLQQRI